MSGTSLDGIDVALVETDGGDRVIPGPALTIAYPDAFRERLRGSLGGVGPIAAVEAELTRLHAEAVEHFLARHPADRDRSRRLSRPHDPALPGRAPHLAIGRRRRLGAPARDRRRRRFPLGRRRRRRRGRAVGAALPCGARRGIAKAARRPQSRRRRQCDLDRRGRIAEPQILAFDTGPGNALIDDWVRRHTGAAADFGGALAHAGQACEAHVARFLERAASSPATPPKSLDRDEFRDAAPDGLSLEDGAATLTEMTAAAVAAARRHFPAPAREWLVCGGGRHNPALMAALARRLGAPVRPVEAVGWNGDALEAQAFAYLAVRSAAGLPLSLPSTTGVPRPMPGGRLFPGR